MMTRRWNRQSGSADTGAAIEKRAANWLKDKGLQLVETNYRCKLGEIDIIMLDNRQLVFVEVRYRRSSSFGSGLESVDWRKQRKLHRAATHYLMSSHRFANSSCRFDVVAASPVSNTGQLEWHWIQDAFSG